MWSGGVGALAHLNVSGCLVVSTPGTQDETQSKPSGKRMHNAIETEDNDKYGNAQGKDSQWGSGGHRKGNSRGTWEKHGGIYKVPLNESEVKGQ